MGNCPKCGSEDINEAWLTIVPEPPKYTYHCYNCNSHTDKKENITIKTSIPFLTLFSNEDIEFKLEKKEE